MDKTTDAHITIDMAKLHGILKEVMTEAQLLVITLFIALAEV